MADKKNYRIETLVLHAENPPDPATNARGVPVHRTSSYVFKNTEHAAKLFSLKELGNIYTRLMNPTQEMLEKRMAVLEGGTGALALASGTSAIFYSIINTCRAGDEVVSMNNLYGGTYTMFKNILPQFNIKVNFVNHDNLDEIEGAINHKTRALYAETIGNPVLGVTDLEEIAAIAKKHHIPFIVDSTFTPPSMLRPIEHGADIVVHSLTKWLGGHGTGIGGIVVEAGEFDWKDEKFSLFNEPDSSYHGLRFAHDLGELSSIAFTLRMRLVPLRNLGACISPDNAWMFLQGLETMPLRMERHCENALRVATFLKSHRYVSWVRYPGLEDDPAYPVAKKYLKNGFGGMVVFGIKGDYKAGVRLIDNIELLSHLANVGDAKSLILHPSSTSHSQLSEEEQATSGLTPDLIRLSIGIEHIDDILEALESGLGKSQR
jgi:O-acetylhomoserine (thiol)-lyase